MSKMPFKNSLFDCVIDVFSSTNLNKKDGESFISESSRILKKKGLFYSYFPSKNSSMFKSKKKKLIDRDTIIKLNSSKHAYRINNIPFRFMSKQNYIEILKTTHLYEVPALTGGWAIYFPPSFFALLIIGWTSGFHCYYYYYYNYY